MGGKATGARLRDMECWACWIVAGNENENEEDGRMAKVYKRWKIGNIGYIVGLQQLKWQQIGNTIGNKRQQPKLGLSSGERGKKRNAEGIGCGTGRRDTCHLSLLTRVQ